MNELRISTDPGELDIPLIHRFLSTQSTWAQGIGEELVRRSIANSICFGGYIAGQQVAFARVVTDRATFANLVDVFVLPECRGLGFSKQLMEYGQNTLKTAILHFQLTDKISLLAVRALQFVECSHKLRDILTTIQEKGAFSFPVSFLIAKKYYSYQLLV